MAGEVIELILRLKDQVSPAAREATGELRKTKQASDDTARSMNHLGERAGDMGGKSRQLSRALGMLSPAARSAALDVYGLGNAVEIAGEGAAALGIGLGPMLAILAGVALQVGVVAAAWRGYTEDERESERVGKDLTEMHRQMKPVLEDTADSMLKLQVALGLMTEAEYEQTRASQEALNTWNEATAKNRSRIAELKQDQESLTTTIVDGLTTYADYVDVIGLGSMALDGLTTTSAEMQGEIERLQAGVDGETDALRKNKLARETLTEVEEEGRKAKEAETQARKDATAAAKAEAEQRRKEAAAAQAQAQAVSYLQAATLSLMDPQERIAETYRRQVEELERLKTAGADVNTVLEGQAVAARVALEAWTDLQEAKLEGANWDVADSIDLDQFQADLEAAVQEAFAEPWGKATKGMNALAGGSSGLLGLLGEAGPIGETAAGAIGLAQSLGATNEDGSSAFASELQGAVDGVIAGLSNLGPVLSELVVGLLTESIPGLLGSIDELVKGILLELVPALLEMLLDPSFWGSIAWAIGEAILGSLAGVAEFLVRLIGEAFQGITQLFSGDFWKGVGAWIADAIRELLGGWFGKDGKIRNGLENVGETIAGWFTGSFATGTDYITRTGLALVHQGERITPATGANSGRTAAMMGGGGSGPVLQINSIWPPTPAQMNDIIREFNRHLGASGRHLTLAG